MIDDGDGGIVWEYSRPLEGVDAGSAGRVYLRVLDRQHIDGTGDRCLRAAFDDHGPDAAQLRVQSVSVPV
jgi:hypothetical protein